MKKYSILKVILLVILVVSACTWIFPMLSFSSELVESERQQIGIFDLFAYVAEAFRYFQYIILMSVAIGAFYGVAYKIPAYRRLLDVIVTKFKGKEFIFLIATMVIISAIVSVTGLSFGMLFVFPFIISVVLLMGYNKLVAASVTVGSTVVGLIGTTLGSSSVHYINLVLATDVYNEMVSKIILLLIGLVLLGYNVISYAKKTKNDIDEVLEFVPSSLAVSDSVKVVKQDVKEEKVEDKKASKKVSKEKEETKSKKTKENDTKSKKATSTKTTSKKTTDSKKTTAKKTTTSKKSTKTKAYDLRSKDEIKVAHTKNKKPAIWPFILVFDVVLIILAIATLDWKTVFETTWQTNALNAVNDFTIKGFPIFSKILGNLNEFGSWNLNYEMPGLIILATCFLGFIYGLKFNKFLEGALDGIKKASKPAFYMFIVYVVLIIVTYHPFQLHFAKFFLGLTKNLNVVTLTITLMLSSIFNIESAYVAQSTLPYVTSIITDTTLYPIISVITQAVYGLMMLVAPTSVILLGTLSYLDIPYTQWLKHIWKLFVELLVVLVIVFFVLTVI